MRGAHNNLNLPTKDGNVFSTVLLDEGGEMAKGYFPDVAKNANDSIHMVHRIVTFLYNDF
jgi:hypothetical protein